jgi:hypothetical protein
VGQVDVPKKVLAALQARWYIQNLALGTDCPTGRSGRCSLKAGCEEVSDERFASLSKKRLTEILADVE